MSAMATGGGNAGQTSQGSSTLKLLEGLGIMPATRNLGQSFLQGQQAASMPGVRPGSMMSPQQRFAAVMRMYQAPGGE